MSGTKVYVGGNFTTIAERPRRGFAAFDLSELLTVPGPGGLGDINNDGIVNVGDVTMLGELLSINNPPPASIGDINGAGVVNWADVQALAEMIVNGQ